MIIKKNDFRRAHNNSSRPSRTIKRIQNDRARTLSRRPFNICNNVSLSLCSHFYVFPFLRFFDGFILRKIVVCFVFSWAMNVAEERQAG